jgi:hypothetical protein
MPTYIVVAGGTNTGNAQLAIDGEALCTFDTAVTSGSRGNYVVAASGSTAGDCSGTTYASLSLVPFGAWIIGQLNTNFGIAANATGLVFVHPGYRSLGTITSLSNSSATILATALSSLSTAAANDVVSVDGTGNIQDSGTLSTNLVTAGTNLTLNQPVVGNGSKGLTTNQSPAMTSPTMTTQPVGDNSTKGATTAYVRSEIQMTWSCHVSAAANSSTQTSCQWTLPSTAAITFTQFEIHAAVAAASCTTYPTFALYDSTSSGTVGSFQVTFTNGTTNYSAVTGSTSVAAGHVIIVKATTVAAGCGTLPIGIDATAMYQMSN